MKKLLLSNGQHALVDDSDYNSLSCFSWNLTSNGYVRRTERDKKDYKIQRTIMLHRLIIGAKGGEYVDHKNHNKLDNRRSNLRICTPLESSRNRRVHKDSNSGFSGVSRASPFTKDKPWRARIFCKKYIYLGSFIKKEDAARAYNEAAKKYFGEFANLNKIHA